LLETAWAKIRDNATTECRRITEHLREHHADEVLQLHEKYAETLRLRY
jgi:F0F1-type ATP synthase membrane subunit b/b'